MTSTLRLNLFLARAGVASRRAADKLIESGRVRLNGVPITTLGTQLDPEQDRVEVDGRPVGVIEEMHYLLLNKPPGHVTTARDPRGRPTVLDLIGPQGARLYPVGRLDMESEGLLFLMNDGRLAFRLTHPKFEVPKTYRAWTSSPPNDAAVQQLREGVQLEDGWTSPATVQNLGTTAMGHGDSGPALDITIHEGRNRQIRRMLEALGYPVRQLRRIRFGPIELGSMAPGKFRSLTRSEIDELRRFVRLPNA